MDERIEDFKVRRALAALGAMSETWAASFNLRLGVKAMLSLPDAESRIVALVKQAHSEGLYAGRMSHKDAA